MISLPSLPSPLLDLSCVVCPSSAALLLFLCLLLLLLHHLLLLLFLLLFLLVLLFLLLLFLLLLLILLFLLALLCYALIFIIPPPPAPGVYILGSADGMWPLVPLLLLLLPPSALLLAAATLHAWRGWRVRRAPLPPLLPPWALPSWLDVLLYPVLGHAALLGPRHADRLLRIARSHGSSVTLAVFARLVTKRKRRIRRKEKRRKAKQRRRE